MNFTAYAVDIDVKIIIFFSRALFFSHFVFRWILFTHFNLSYEYFESEKRKMKVNRKNAVNLLLLGIEFYILNISLLPLWWSSYCCCCCCSGDDAVVMHLRFYYFWCLRCDLLLLEIVLILYIVYTNTYIQHTPCELSAAIRYMNQYQYPSTAVAYHSKSFFLVRSLFLMWGKRTTNNNNG